MLVALSTYLHHDAITGTAKQAVANDYRFRMNNAIERSRKIYSQLIKKVIADQTEIKFTKDLSFCEGHANETFYQCPVYKMKENDQNSFFVIAHNSANKVNNQFIRIKLPQKNFKAEVWDK